MSYIEGINNELKIPAMKPKYQVLDLFAGCGGMALGFESVGFITIGFEKDNDCCNTYNDNLSGKCNETFLTPSSELPNAQVIIGGPPCQPFSVGGKQHGLKDSRDGFPAYISAVERIRPEIFVIENVRGLLYKNKWYLEEIIAHLEAEGYIIEYELLNAVNYGVPQNRERVFIVGHKGKFRYPEMVEAKVTAGEALGELAVSIPDGSKFLTPNQDAYIEKYERASMCKVPRDLHLDRPSRTLTCRNLAGATGDMMRVKLPDGRRRRINIREAARLQSFPDWFVFSGMENSSFYQIGNAVPPLFSKQIAECVKEYLESELRYSKKEIKELNRKPQQLSMM